ncbi:MAG TPA: metallophosphoesterase [Planctomycetota bacterium]|nr:metallophosphoesterase [Planctomycetota bacterium]
MNKTVVLSDLHLGRVTTYARAPEVIEPLVEGFDRVLLLGDIIDHWYTRPQQVRELEQRIFSVCKKAGVRQVMYFRGNHDACTETGEEFALIDGILYLHGHAVYHRLKGDGCPATRIKNLNSEKFGSFRLGSRVDRHVWTVIDRVYGSIPMALLSPIAWPWPVTQRIKALVQEIAPHGGVRGVVLGHSHRPGVRKLGDLTLFNLGGWMKNTRAYGFIRDHEKIKLVHVENRSHTLRWGHVLHEGELQTPLIGSRSGVLDAVAKSSR